METADEKVQVPQGAWGFRRTGFKKKSAKVERPNWPLGGSRKVDAKTERGQQDWKPQGGKFDGSESKGRSREAERRMTGT